MTDSADRNIPEKPKNSFRVTLKLNARAPRLDSVLMDALRKQSRNLDLMNLSRSDFKELFNKKKVLIKGQPARPSSSLAAGTTYIDILGFPESVSSQKPKGEL